MAKQLIFKEEVYAIIGAAMEVHKEKGCGFAEPVYQECMEIELAGRNVPAEAQKEMKIFYKRRQLKKTYLADFIAYGKIIVELKALDQLTSREESQVINYLKASGFEVGLLINFGAQSLQWKRIVLTNQPIDSVDLQVQTQKISDNSRNSRI
ncbi:MAG TPA: GxxExxY protein [Verrucomicrobiae bacterium]|jgi:GxxExxY protein